MNTETTSEHATEQPGSSEQNSSTYERRLLTILLLAFAAFGVWIWTGILLLSPVSTSLDGGMDHGDCGTPMTYNRAKEAADYSDRWAVACEGAVDLRARQALGLGLASIPITGLWVYLASQQHRLANESKPAEAETGADADADTDADADADASAKSESDSETESDES